jgi:formamidopyrimidine-DNA glycosylase
VCRRLRENLPARIQDREIVAARLLRPSVSRPQPVAKIESAVAGRRIETIRRAGKHILIDLEGAAESLHVHLRMTGNLYVIPDVRFHVATTRAWFELRNGSGVIFDDPRALGKIQLQPRSFVPDVGPEPHELTADEFVAMAKRVKAPAKLFLMDQSKIAGLGNIYAAEALFQARIHPAKATNSISKPKLQALHGVIVRMLEDAKESAYRAYTEPGYFAEGESFPVAVYDREGEACFTCNRKIRRIPQGGRSTYFCPGCQR